MDVLAALNAAQKEAVESIQGPVLILAGPGSGKTRVIAHHVAYLVKVCGVSPYRIIAVTFTNKAAKEMKERLFGLLSRAVDELTIGTFHAICARILRVDGTTIGLDKRFVIYDETDRLSLIKRSLKDIQLDSKQHPPRAIQSAISAAKAHLLSPRDWAKQTKNYFDEVVQRVYERYERLLVDNNALDFDDLLMKTVQLFSLHSEVLEKYQSRYLHVLVDEFQDTNAVQYALAKQLAGKHRNIYVVGDPDQSIYSWRFADVGNMLSFEKDFPEVKTVYLEQNYRSTKTILEAADGVIAANRLHKDRKLWTDNITGEAITVTEAYDEQEEAQFIVSEVDRIVKSGQFRLNECAVMYRTNAQSRAIEEAFVLHGIPYRLIGGTRFYERREIRDILAYLRVLHNHADSVSMQRIINVPGRSIGQKSISELVRLADESGASLFEEIGLLIDQDETTRLSRKLADFYKVINDLVTKAGELTVGDLIDLIIDRIGYKEYILEGEGGEERWDNILELRTVADSYSDLDPQDALTAFLVDVSLVSDVDELDEKVDAVTLITLHQAKGLEFPVVFIAGMEERLLPHIRSFDDAGQMEEERRLCYVGITRAMQKIYLVRAFRRNFMGIHGPNPPSRFLADIPGNLITPPYRRAKLKVDQAMLHMLSDVLKAGDHVRHPQFGEGIVVASFPVKDDQEVTVVFKNKAGIKRLFASMALLEKI